MNRQFSLHPGVFPHFFFHSRWHFLAVFFPRKQKKNNTMGCMVCIMESIGVCFLKVHSIEDTLYPSRSLSHFMLLIAFAGSNRKGLGIWYSSSFFFYIFCSLPCKLLLLLQKIGFFFIFGEKCTHTHTPNIYSIKKKWRLNNKICYKKFIESSLNSKSRRGERRRERNLPAVKRGVNKTQNSNCICRTSIYTYLGWKIDWKKLRKNI